VELTGNAVVDSHALLRLLVALVVVGHGKAGRFFERGHGTVDRGLYIHRVGLVGSNKLQSPLRILFVLLPPVRESQGNEAIVWCTPFAEPLHRHLAQPAGESRVLTARDAEDQTVTL